MLREFTDVAQQRGVTGRRRWFSDNDMDLIVWYGEDGGITGFQLCYDRRGKERAFTWKADGAFTHDAVDAGEDTPQRNDSPILVAGGPPPLERVLAEFKARAAELEPEIAELVAARLAQFPAR